MVLLLLNVDPLCRVRTLCTDIIIRELKQGRRQLQRERQKCNRFIKPKHQICTRNTLCCTFLCRRSLLDYGPRLTGLVRFPRSRFTFKSFVKFSMCSYERAGWQGCRNLGFSNRDLGKRAGNFAIWTLYSGYRDERRNEFWRAEWHRLALPAVFSTS